MREQARVFALDGQHALVVGQKQRGCGTCPQEAGCSTLSLGGGNKEVHVRALNPIGAEVGDLVTLEISNRHFLRSSFLVYVVPVLVLFCGGFLFQSIGSRLGLAASDAEALGGGAGMLCFGLFFFWLKQRNKRLEKRGAGVPTIVEIAHPLEACATVIPIKSQHH
ncbi:MAG: SoxR reducing system RseC family protein [Magnetococcales bacterium]|nr:SoxR reducing system RseC family protein [Magnetococcales bacterium]MBF0322391.1 SoxR reducing system RseC family protein [Magnetococcales bacterium]